LVLAGPRNTDGVIAGNIFFANFICGAGPGIGPCPVYPGIVPTAGFTPFNPGIAVFEKNFKNPQTIQYSASIEREVYKDLNLLIAYNYAKADRLTRFVNRGDARLYGGGEMGNAGGVMAEPAPYHSQPYSLGLTLPPLAAVFLKSEGLGAPGA